MTSRPATRTCAPSPRVLATLAVLACLWGPLTGTSQAQEAARTAAIPAIESNPTLERSLLRHTNAARAEHGRSPLGHHEGLAVAARRHAAHMAELGFLSHDSPDPARATVGRRLALAGVPLVEHGENVARVSGHMDVARESVEGWLASPTHRDNLLSEGFSHVGFGTATADDGTVYVAQVLAANPLERRGASASPVTETVHRWTLELSARDDERVAVFVDGRGRPPRQVDAGASTLQLELEPAERHRLELGVAIGEGRYQLQDAAWLDAATGELRRDGSTPGDRLQLEAAHMEEVHYRRIVLDLRYAEVSHELVLFVDGSHRPGAQVASGHLRTSVPREGPDLTVEVGIARSEGGDGAPRARIVERYLLVREEAPELRAAAP